MVSELHREGVPGRRLARSPGRVRGRHVLAQRLPGEPIAGDVVQHEQQNMLVWSELEQPGPDGNLGATCARWATTVSSREPVAAS